MKKIQKSKKVGALANPHQKINDARQDKNRTAEATPTSSSGSASATTSATKATPAIPATVANVTQASATLPEVDFTVDIPATLVPPSAAAASAAGAAFSFGQVETKGKGLEVQ